MAENSRKKRAFEAWKNSNNGDNYEQFDQSKGEHLYSPIRGSNCFHCFSLSC